MRTVSSFAAALGLAALSTACGDEVPAACPARSALGTEAPGTTHVGGVLSADTVWRAEGSPHLVMGTVSILEGASLTIEPCAEVRIDAGARLEVGSLTTRDPSRLIAKGDAGHPIRFTSIGDSSFGALVVVSPAKADLSHVTIVNGGAATDFGAAALIALGEETLPITHPLAIDHVSVVSSKGHGAIVAGAGAFAAGSSDLEIKGADAHPLVIGEHAINTLPSGVYTGNETDEVLVIEDAPNARPGLQIDTTMRDLGVPYRIGRHPDEGLRVGANGGPTATLTIEAGVELRFTRGTSLRVVSDMEAPRGSLQVLGSELSPVRLTSAEAVGTGGDWTGLYFESPMGDHHIDHAIIEYAGGDCSCSLASCSPLVFYDAAIVLDGAPQSAFIENTVIRQSRGHGVLRSWQDHTDLDFTANNTFEDITGCTQTEPLHSDLVCPDATFDCMPN